MTKLTKRYLRTIKDYKEVAEAYINDDTPLHLLFDDVPVENGDDEPFIETEIDEIYRDILFAFDKAIDLVWLSRNPNNKNLRNNINCLTILVDDKPVEFLITSEFIFDLSVLGCCIYKNQCLFPFDFRDDFPSEEFVGFWAKEPKSISFKTKKEYESFWPQGPRRTAFNAAGGSILEAIGNFSEKVRALCCDSIPPINRPNDFENIVVYPKPDKIITAWETSARKQLNLFLPISDWSDGKIKTEIEILNIEAEKEYEEAIKQSGNSQQKLPKSSDLIFKPGQVLYNDKDIEISPGFMIETLKRLYNNMEAVVPYKELDSNSTDIEASSYLRKEISGINKCFREHEVPYEITNKRSEGYMLVHLPPHTS